MYLRSMGAAQAGTALIQFARSDGDHATPTSAITHLNIIVRTIGLAMAETLELRLDAQPAVAVTIPDHMQSTTMHLSGQGEKDNFAE